MTTPRSPDASAGGGRAGQTGEAGGGRAGQSHTGQTGESGPGYDRSSTAERDYQASRTWQQAEVTGFGPGFAAAAWPAFMSAGIASIVVGVILLAWPKETLTVVAVLIGIALVVAGVLRLMDGFTSHDAGSGKRIASVVIGLAAIVLGLYCVRHYHFTITALAIIAGLFWVIYGIAEVAVGLLAGPFPGRGFSVLTGVLSIGAGCVVLFWPTISLTVLVMVIGIWLIVYGLLGAVLGFRLRRAGQAPPGPPPLSAA